MGSGALFEPSLQGFLGYCVGFFIRYFAIAGGFYGVFHVVFRERWRGYRIQGAFPPRQAVAYEIRWSIVNTVCTGLSTLLIYRLIHDGRTSMYFQIAEHGWAWWLGSIALCIAGYDTWIYWQHRWLHTPWLFRHVHLLHHRLTNPTVFAAFAQHPLETVMGNIYFVLFVVYVPLHPLALAAAGAYMFLFGVLAHSGYEFYPRGFTRHWLLGWLNTSTNHNMHHRHVACNYGNWFTYWDRLMGTLHPAYHDTFDAVARRGGTVDAAQSSAGARRAA
jgi:lathosterol oxidase